jgi:hypothetical protein
MFVIPPTMPVRIAIIAPRRGFFPEKAPFMRAIGIRTGITPMVINAEVTSQ